MVDSILTTARGPLMLSPRLRLMLRLIPPFSMVPMDTPMPVPMVDTGPTVPTPLLTDMDTEPMEPTPILTTERGPLMLSPRLRPRLTPPSSTPPPMLSLPRSLTPASPRSTLASPRSLTPAPSGRSSPRLSTMLPPPGRHPVHRPRDHRPQGPRPRCRLYLRWTRPLFPRWSLPEQRGCPGPLLNSTTSTSPNNNEINC